MITFVDTEVKNRFLEVLDATQREPVTITRQGMTVAYIISPEELKKLFASQEERGKAVAAYEDYRKRVRQKASPLTATLTDEDINQLVHELR